MADRPLPTPLSAAALCGVLVLTQASALPAGTDYFGSGDARFGIEFVTISGETNPASPISAGPFSPYSFRGVADDYRISVFQTTNDQWEKFLTNLALPLTGSPVIGYDEESPWSGPNIPITGVSWLEAAQFVNWLNTSQGHQPAYRFTGNQGTADYSFALWSPSEAAAGTNLFRHKDAFYFLPTEDEWVKAAYWNGASLQSFATPDGSAPVAGEDANFAFVISEPWDVGSGSIELNGTFDMMGNVWEWLESPSSPSNFVVNARRSVRGGAAGSSSESQLAFTTRNGGEFYYEHPYFGFRVASVIPEPASLALLGLGGLALLRRRPA